jgi:hypothetical protein
VSVSETRAVSEVNRERTSEQDRLPPVRIAPGPLPAASNLASSRSDDERIVLCEERGSSEHASLRFESCSAGF